MTRRTGNRWSIDECRSCFEPHTGYAGKLDSAGVEYVVCGSTNKRMDVGASYEGNHLRNVWRKENPFAYPSASENRWRTDKCQKCGGSHAMMPATMNGGGSEFVVCLGVSICVSMSWADGNDGSFDSGWTVDTAKLDQPSSEAAA